MVDLFLYIDYQQGDLTFSKFPSYEIASEKLNYIHVHVCYVNMGTVSSISTFTFS